MDPSARLTCEELLEHTYFDSFREELESLKEQQQQQLIHHHPTHRRRRARRTQGVTHKPFDHFPVSFAVTNFSLTN